MRFYWIQQPHFAPILATKNIISLILKKGKANLLIFKDKHLIFFNNFQIHKYKSNIFLILENKNINLLILKPKKHFY